MMVFRQLEFWRWYPRSKISTVESAENKIFHNLILKEAKIRVIERALHFLKA